MSIFERIKSNITSEGELPWDFFPDEPDDPSKPRLLPGMLDGAGIFGHYNPGNPEKEAKQVVNLLKKHMVAGDDTTLDEIRTILSSISIIAAIDPILRGLQESCDKSESEKLYLLGIYLAHTSEDVDLVKLGIVITGLYDMNGEAWVQGIITTLALCNEFTLYAAVAASGWTNGNDLVFQMVQRVDGWGKILAMKCLEPETDEIRDWILRHGCSNRIMDAYLGLICANKGDLISVLRRDCIDNELFTGISIIIDALLDEGPTAGISKYEYAEEALALYAKHVKEHPEQGCTIVE